MCSAYSLEEGMPTASGVQQGKSGDLGSSWAGVMARGSGGVVDPGEAGSCLITASLLKGGVRIWGGASDLGLH